MQLLRNLAALLATNFIWGGGGTGGRALTGGGVPFGHHIEPRHSYDKVLLLCSCCPTSGPHIGRYRQYLSRRAVRRYSSARGTTRASRL